MNRRSKIRIGTARLFFRRCPVHGSSPVYMISRFAKSGPEFGLWVSSGGPRGPFSILGNFFSQEEAWRAASLAEKQRFAADSYTDKYA
jgi:hypothetical protein